MEDRCSDYRGIEGESAQARALESFPRQGTLSSTWRSAIEHRGVIIDSLIPDQLFTWTTVRCYGRDTWSRGACGV